MPKGSKPPEPIRHPKPKKNRLIILQCVDCSQKETNYLTQMLGEHLSKSGYTWIITNKKIESLDTQDFLALISRAASLLHPSKNMQEFLQDLKLILEGKRLDD